MNDYTPKPEHKFTFGLWTVGNRGRDPFGDFVRPPVTPIQIVKKLSSLGAYGVNLHDNDLVPIDASPSERDSIVKEFKQALSDYNMHFVMGTTNLFFDPLFKDGAFTSNHPQVRAFTLQKCMQAIDLAAEMGAETYVFWGGREGTETDAGKDPIEALKWFRDGINFLIHYVKDQGYPLKFAFEPKPNEPRGDIYLPTVGSMLAFIETLDDPAMCGVNPEVAHENMAGLNFVHAVAQAIERGKLFHIDLNGQKFSRYDQDFRFGAEDIKGAFFLVKMLEESGYGGPRHFDAHAYRTEDEEGVWEFAKGCMRTYLILREKANRFHQDEEIQGILEQIHAWDTDLQARTSYSKENADWLRAHAFDLDALRNYGYQYEKLDQLTTELLLGIR
ncbi:MAG: xylose isomerase [Fimbriimonadia bacterium]|nr:xylose isomerase [Fimbriimonadia bacterium]